MNKGKVYLIGAGPGDPDLITVKGLDALKIADVIVYDRLANDILLSYCKSDSEKIYAGKSTSKHTLTQQDIIDVLIDRALKGNIVARLKGGDPYIFGRGSEEAIELFKKGIDFEVIPGITAAIGVSSYAGIPLTQRNLVTQCLFVTAHESPDKHDSQVDWKKIAELKNATIVIYMGAAMLEIITEKLISFGLETNTPVAVIENGTLNTQRTVIGTLDTIYQKVIDKKLNPPLITIISLTVNEHLNLNWFEKKTLFGKRIVTTRASDQSFSLFKMLLNEGAEVISFKSIATEVIYPPKFNGVEIITDYESIFQKEYDWFFFTSENGVRYFFQILQRYNLDARVLAKSKIAVIGEGTSRKLSEFSIIPDFIPEKFTSNDLINEFCNKFEIKNKKILRIKGDFKNDFLSDGLINKGASVDKLEVYKLFSDSPDQRLIEDLIKKGADGYIFTSTSTVENFFATLSNKIAIDLLNKSNVIAIGPVTEKALLETGVRNVKVAEEHSLIGIFKLLLKLFN